MAQRERIPLADAEALARGLLDELRSACVRVEIAGSIRRRRPDVGDIEIVAIPRMDSEPWGLIEGMVRPVNRLEERCALLRGPDGLLPRLDERGRACWGERLKRATWRGFAADLFSVVAPAQWGAILAIRTGSAEFSRRLVTSKLHGGMMPSHLRVKDGALWRRDGEMVPTPEEADVFAAIGLAWIPPEARE